MTTGVSPASRIRSAKVEHHVLLGRHQQHLHLLGVAASAPRISKSSETSLMSYGHVLLGLPVDRLLRVLGATACSSTIFLTMTARPDTAATTFFGA